MVVDCHGGEVEESGVLGGVGVFFCEFEGWEVVVDGAFGGIVEFVAEVAHVLVPV